MAMHTQVEHLRMIFEQRQDQLFLVSAHHGLTLTYGQVMERSGRLASWMQARGVKAGDRVNFIARNSIDLAVLFFAAWHLEAQVVPVNHQLNADHLGEILADSAPSLIIADTETAVGLKDRIPNELQDKLAVFQRYEDIDEGKPAAVAGYFDVQTLSAQNEADDPQIVPFGQNTTDKTAFLRIYTSGTTKKPKGIDISYGGLIGNERLFCRALDIDKANRFYNILPMSYLGGVHNLLLLPASVGASVVIDEPLGGANLYGFWDTVRDKGINTLWFTSAMLAMLMALRDDDDMAWVHDRVKIALVGMAPLSVSLKKEFEARFGFMLYENFAMSETTFISTNRPDLPYRDGSSGQILEGVSVSILDQDGNTVPDGVEGQVYVETPYMMLGYVNAPEEDLKNVRSGGMFTGDLGYLDGEELFITGRIKDLIIRGGLNISPAQIEYVLLQLPEILEAAVVGVPHPVYGEEVAAAVTLRTGANDCTDKSLLSALTGRIEHFQKPKKLLILDEMPKGLTGKIDKKKISSLFTMAA